MSLLDQLAAARVASHEANADDWRKFDQILARADSPEPKDGMELLQLAGRLNVPVAELAALTELSRRRQQLQREVDQLAAAQEEKAKDVTRLGEKLRSHQAGLMRLKADRGRMLADLPGEISRLEEAKQLVAAVADAKGTGDRETFLRARGWESVFIPGLPLLSSYRVVGGGPAIDVRNVMAQEAARILSELGPQTASDALKLDADLVGIPADVANDTAVAEISEGDASAPAVGVEEKPLGVNESTEAPPPTA
jgi:hypothetical protein